MRLLPRSHPFLESLTLRPSSLLLPPTVSPTWVLVTPRPPPLPLTTPLPPTSSTRPWTRSLGRRSPVSLAPAATLDTLAWALKRWLRTAKSVARPARPTRRTSMCLSDTLRRFPFLSTLLSKATNASLSLHSTLAWYLAPTRCRWVSLLHLMPT